MTTDVTASAPGRVVRLPEPGLLGGLMGHFKQRPDAYQPFPGKVRVYMPGKPAKVTLFQHLLRALLFWLPCFEPDGHFSRWLDAVRTVPARSAVEPWHYDVYYPEVFWAAGSLGDRIRKIGQLIHKTALGYGLNYVGLGFFAFAYYVTTQNGYMVNHWNFLLNGLLGVAGWMWLRHLVVRDTGEWLYRLTFGWMAVTNALAPKRQQDRHGAFARALEKTKVIPSEAEGDIGWFRRLVQILLSWLTVYIAAIPGLTIVFGIIGIIGLFDSSLYAHLMAKAPSYAATLGALMFGKMVFSRLALAFQAMVIDLFNDHGRKMRAWMLVFPAHIRAWQNSGLAPASKGRGLWRVPVLVLSIVLIAIGARVGYWILGHAEGYLQNHTLFSQVGFHYMLSSMQSSFVHWVTHLGPSIVHLLQRAHLAR